MMTNVKHPEGFNDAVELQILEKGMYIKVSRNDYLQLGALKRDSLVLTGRAR